MTDVTIPVHELIGENGLTKEQGDVVYKKIYPLLIEDVSVTLDFSEVGICFAGFFSYSIGRLLLDIPYAKLKTILKVVNLDAVKRETLKNVVDNTLSILSTN